MNYIVFLISILCLQESYGVTSSLTVDCSSQTTNISLLSAPTTLSSYPALKSNITTSSSLLQSVEGTTTLQSKLQASGGYIMSKLNGERAAVLVDYAKFFKANTGKENAFKNDNYAFDAWWIGAKSSAGTTTELTDADMSPGLVGVDGGSKELLYAKKVIAPANTLDMIIHANGSSYKFEINGSYIEGDHRVLAGWLKSKGYNTQTIRLLSCSELSSAQNLCNKLNQAIIATDGYVCIYSDGGLSVVPRNGNGDTKWYSLKPGNIRNEMASPRAPDENATDFVQMGTITKIASASKPIVADPFNANGTLKANVRYNTGQFANHLGETDKLGRIISMKTDNLQMTNEAKRLRDDPNSMGKEPGDHVGHLIEDRFGGSPKLDNIISQLARVNLSSFKIIEKAIDPPINSGLQPVTVSIEIKVIYTSNDLRPSSFVVKYAIDDNEEITSPDILND